MINPHDAIKLTNVVSRKYRFYYRDLERYLAEFIQDIFSLNLTIKGPLIYSLHNVPMDEMMNVEFYMPVAQDRVETPPDMDFHSYFFIGPMISTVDLVNSEASMEAAYASLFHYMEQNHLRQVTPIFHVASGDETLQYMTVKIGAAKKDIEEIWK